ncbi:HesB/YadR/YfhF family protein [Alkalicoccus daliensis]|uniref:Uncharacterized protein YneR n=1 Tax=Alkalicoccus daliensis TaxID=745820 RepID=A0A1G9ZDV2_9BACI|nr:iron-sulfur cluster biosynthesis family protein [Alkalicoccus daliensis]SDN18643.1 Uncharacterized protein YneR [Alkalicoccus daliensis]
MQIFIKDEAAAWFKEELLQKEEESIQFFVRYGGCGDFQSGFSLGVTVNTPEDPAAVTEKNGITYFIEEKDAWYFDEKDLTVVYDREKAEIAYEHSL